MARSREQFEVDDGSTRRAKHTAGGRTAIAVPEGLSFWKPKKTGSHTVDVVPFRVTENRNKYAEKLRYSSKVGVLYPERTYWVHYGIGINEDSYTCSAQTFGKPCPICEKRAILSQSPNQDDLKLANKLKPKERQLFLIFDHDNQDTGLQLWEVSYHCFFRMLEMYIDGAPANLRERYSQYFNPTGGFTLRLTCKEEPSGPGQKDHVKYYTHSLYERTQPLPQSAFPHNYDLDAIPRQIRYEDLKNILDGRTDDDSDDAPDESQQAPAPRQTERTQRNGDDRPVERQQPAKQPEPAPQRQPSKPKSFATGDTVSFEFQGKRITGKIVSVNLDDRFARVQGPHSAKPSLIEFDELEMVERDSTFDLPGANDPDPKPAPSRTSAPATKPASGWDVDDDDDNAPFQKR